MVCVGGAVCDPVLRFRHLTRCVFSPPPSPPVPVLRLQEVVAAASSAYPALVPGDLSRRIPDIAGETTAWLSGALTSVRSQQVLPAFSAAWPDGEVEGQSEAAAELGLEILILIAFSSAFMPALVGFIWRSIFRMGGGEREPRRYGQAEPGGDAPAARLNW